MERSVWWHIYRLPSSDMHRQSKSDCALSCILSVFGIPLTNLTSVGHQSPYLTLDINLASLININTARCYIGTALVGLVSSVVFQTRCGTSE